MMSSSSDPGSGSVSVANSCPQFYFKFGSLPKEMWRYSSLGKFYLALNSVSPRWEGDRRISQHESMDNRAPPQNYNLIQGWSVSKSNQRYSHDAVPSLKFPVSFSADYHLCVLYIQNIQIVQEKFDDSIKQFDPSSNIFLHYLGCPGKARFLPIIFINNECRVTSRIEAS